MWAGRYWAARYWGQRYWGKAGASASVVVRGRVIEMQRANQSLQSTVVTMGRS